MVENRTDEALKAARLIRICKWIYSKRGLFWSTVFLGLGINILATLLFTTWPWSINLKQTTIGWALQNPWTIGAIGLFVWLLDVIIYLASRLPVGPSERAVKRAYLARLSQDNVLLNLNGVPAGLMARRVKLDEVFIPLKFRPTLPLEEYSLTQREIADLHNQRGQKAQEIDRLVIEAERKWERGFQKYDKVDISWLWERLTNKEPVAVIQGYPGMGKSTLLTRLMLYMARRCLREPDASMPALNPALIPLFVSLKEYADERENNTQDLPLLDYLKVDTVRKCNNPALAAFVEKWLSDCSCLVLLDGLDEISELTTRQAIQKAINKFIADQRHPEKQVATFNHFLITSRVAGYDLVAFPHYPHYFVTELTVEQIEEFLPRWCHASARRDLQDAGDEAIIRLADQTATRLIDTVKTNQGVRELAANPLMLTLLTAMQQSGTELPTYRAELYKVVTKTLLEDRNIAKGIPQLPEAEAIQRLGPLAFKMHDEGNGLTHENEVVAVLKDAINALQEGSGSPDKAEEAARTYLSVSVSVVACSFRVPATTTDFSIEPLKNILLPVIC